jgi:predicted nucleic acid-binding protein
MEPAFWDSSSLVPLCILQLSTQLAEALSQQYEVVVWWAAPVEIRSAFARLLRMGQLTSIDINQAHVALNNLCINWREISPSEQIRDEAERLVDSFPLKAADALQLAAAMTWCLGRSKGRSFISGDRQLLDAAKQLGFQAIQA